MLPARFEIKILPFLFSNLAHVMIYVLRKVSDASDVS